MKYYRTGVHTLVDLLYSPQKILSNKKYDKSFSDMGNVVHLKLGYVGSETFKKYYVYGDYMIEIMGSPDKVNYKEGCVEELKTYSSERSREIQKERGRLQLMFYSWLTGLKCARLVLYDVVNNKMEVIHYNFTEKEVNEVVEKAIKKYIEVREVLSK
jgi:hypothetical protein